MRFFCSLDPNAVPLAGPRGKVAKSSWRSLYAISEIPIPNEPAVYFSGKTSDSCLLREAGEFALCNAAKPPRWAALHVLALRMSVNPDVAPASREQASFAAARARVWTESDSCSYHLREDQAMASEKPPESG